MQIVYLFAFYCGWFLLLIAVHEMGHYLCGRIGGIPADAMRIRLLTFPQHVVLRDEEQWVSPVLQIERYVELVWHYLQTKRRVWFYVAGGILLETLFTVSVGMLLLAFGKHKLAFVLVGLTLFLFLPWLIVDTIAVCRGRVVGDLSGLWMLARMPTAMFILAALTPRAWIMWHAAA